MTSLIRRTMALAIPLGAVGVLAFGVLAPRQRGQASTGCAPVVGHCAPAFQLRDTHDRLVTLAQFHGRAVVLNFWAVSCPPCWQEEPALKRVARTYQSRKLALLGIDAWGEAAPFVRSYLRHDPFPYTVLIDPTQHVADVYNGWRTPETVFVDPRGQITGIHLGPITYTELVQQIRRVLPLSAARADVS